MNVFQLVLSDIFGGHRAQAIEKRVDPVLVPLEAPAAQAAQAEIDSLLDHNTGFALQEIGKGFDMIGLSGVTRTLAEAVVAGGLEHLQVSLAPAASQGGGQAQQDGVLKEGAAPLEQGGQS